MILAHADNPQTDAAGFHLQQCVEKSLKAWLTLRDIDYPRTHDLNVLLGLLEDEGEDVSPYWALLELNPFAVLFRYELPGEAFPNFDALAQLSEALLMKIEALI